MTSGSNLILKLSEVKVRHQQSRKRFLKMRKIAISVASTPPTTIPKRKRKKRKISKKILKS